LDLTWPGIDLIFRDNCYFHSFYLSDENMSEKDLIDKALRTAEILSGIYWSPNWIIEAAPFLDNGMADTGNRQWIFFNTDIRTAFECVSDQAQQHLMECKKVSDSLSLWLIQAYGQGGRRIALPDGGSAFDDWRCADGDGNLRSGQIKGASLVEEISTMWVQMEDAIPANAITIKIEWFGEIQINLKLGNILFQPSLDPRPLDYPIHGKPLSEWQKVNGNLLNHVIENMEKLGFQSCEDL
jgi:hypothetical protein